MPWPRWHRLLPRLLPRLCPTCRKIKDERERSLAHLPEGAAKVTLCRVWLWCVWCFCRVVVASLSLAARRVVTDPRLTLVAGRCLQPFQFIWWDVWVIAHMALA